MRFPVTKAQYISHSFSKLFNCYKFPAHSFPLSSYSPSLSSISINYTQTRANMTFNTSNSIQKPDLDDREYKIVKLPNDLVALLISDPKTDKSAAALDVNVGAFSDYEHLPGLAHFCEHLLFMGTKKYPSENEYSSFLSNHGGHSNAYTAAEDTNYYFEVNHQYLEGALDRFSQFFISPLFDPSCKDREIKAVDSENKKNLQNDLWRLYQLDKSLSNPVHPYHKFSTGNFKTLGEIPESQGIDVRDELLKFYKDSYSSNLMKLAVIGREDLNTLEQWVIEKFSEVPNYNRPVPVFQGELYSSKELKKLIKAKPVMSKNKLELNFLVPDFDENWDAHVSQYFSHLIGHEGKGSLLSFLKSKGFANGLSAGGYTITKGNAVFGINIDLTDTGLENYEEILVNTFQYLELLKISLPQKWIFDELKEVTEMTFKFRQKSSPSATVSKLAKDLQKSYIPDEYLLSRNVIRTYEPELISKFVKYFTVDNLRVTLVSQSVDTDKTEKWYGTEYSIDNLSSELLEKLSNAKLNAHLQLPTVNDFIPTKFDVEKIDDVVPLKKPTILKSDEKSRFWFKKDDQFWVPKGYIQLLINLPITVATPYNYVLSVLFTELVEDALTDVSYQAAIAGLNFGLSNGKEGLVVEVNGYDEKAPVLLDAVLRKLADFKPKEDRFKVLQEKTLRSYKNHYFKVPYNLVTGIFSNMVNEKSWSTEEKIKVLEKLTFKDLENFIPLIFKQGFIEGLIYGNFHKKDASEIIKNTEEILKLEPLADQQKSKPRSYLLSENTFKFDKVLPDEKNTNACIQYYIQLGESTNTKLRAYADLLAQLIKEPAFDVLRTKEQLGYIVFSGILETRTTFGLRIIIQSEKNAPYLESRIVNFFNIYSQTLKDLSQEEFEKNKEALINKNLETLKNLSQENTRFLRALSNGYYDFLYKEEQVEILKTIKKEDILEFYNTAIINSKSKLIVNLHAKANTDDSTTEGFPTGEAIVDSGAFKGSLYLTPAPQPIEDLSSANFQSKL